MKSGVSRRLLVLPCSARKRTRGTALAAIERYDGPTYQSLRKLIERGQFPVDVVVRIVSAKYGLLSPTDRIANYDRRLDPDRDQKLIDSARSKLTSEVRALAPRSVLSLLGKDYQQCLPVRWPARTDLQQADGPPGQRVRTMLDWLGSCS